MSEEDVYFCIKCGKIHSTDYNVHNKYKFDLGQIKEMKKEINKIIDILDNWNDYIKNKHWYWHEDDTGLKKIGEEDGNN